jgi:spoIIIJ-associated protein
MKDQVFSGRTVAEAVEIAGRTLGLAPDAIRYVILDRETAGTLGMGGTPARIAVLLERARTGPAGPAGPQPGADPVRARTERPKDPRAAIRAFVRELGEAGSVDLTAEIEEDEQRLVVRLFGEDRGLLLEEGGEAFAALEHIVQRAFAQEVHPKRLLLECEGYREARDNAIGVRARELAEAVRADGQMRETEPLNSYERRLVHMAVSEVPGVRTFSVGEGADRRVTIALQGTEPPVPAAEGGGGGLVR